MHLPWHMNGNNDSDAPTTLNLKIIKREKKSSESIMSEEQYLPQSAAMSMMLPYYIPRVWRANDRA